MTFIFCRNFDQEIGHLVICIRFSPSVGYCLSETKDVSHLECFHKRHRSADKEHYTFVQFVVLLYIHISSSSSSSSASSSASSSSSSSWNFFWGLSLKKSGEQFNMTGTIGTLRTEVQLLVFCWFLAPRCSRNRPNTLKYRGLLEDTRTFSMRIYVESWNLDITQANAPSKSIQIEGSTNICLQLSTPPRYYLPPLWACVNPKHVCSLPNVIFLT